MKPERVSLSQNLEDWSPLWVLRWNEGGEYLIRRLRPAAGTDDKGELRFLVGGLPPRAVAIIDSLLMLLNEQAYMAAQFGEEARRSLRRGGPGKTRVRAAPRAQAIIEEARSLADEGKRVTVAAVQRRLRRRTKPVDVTDEWVRAVLTKKRPK